MADCIINTNIIYGDENIGDSLEKINTNFQNLKQGACIIESELDDLVNIRTFFYYGPNAPTESEAGSWEQDNQLNRPSDTTIENFVNGTGQLNLPSISRIGDMAYVIYQKTGWYTQATNYQRSGSDRLPFDRLTYYDFQYQATKTRQVPYTVTVSRKIGIAGGKGGGTVTTTETRYRDETYTVTETTQGSKIETYYVGYNWSTDINDQYTHYVPIFVIYRLTYNGTQYVLDSGFPKYSRANTASTTNWNNPRTWTTY